MISVGEAFPGGVAHLGLTAAIRRMFQGSSRRRTARCAELRSLCRVHFLRKLLSHVPNAGQDMAAAAMKAVFVIQPLNRCVPTGSGSPRCSASSSQQPCP